MLPRLVQHMSDGAVHEGEAGEEANEVDRATGLGHQADATEGGSQQQREDADPHEDHRRERLAAAVHDRPVGDAPARYHPEGNVSIGLRRADTSTAGYHPKANVLVES
jgi:hypothetical protein